MTDTHADPPLPTAPAVVREKPGGETMRAIVLEKFGGLDSLVYTDIPKPLPKDGEVVRRGGRACLAGWLGGLAPIANFNPLAQMASGVYLTFFRSPDFGMPGFPVSDVPLSDIAAQVQDGRLDAAPARIFSFDEIREAHRVAESGDAGGKLVVVLD